MRIMLLASLVALAIGIQPSNAAEGVETLLVIEPSSECPRNSKETSSSLRTEDSAWSTPGLRVGDMTTLRRIWRCGPPAMAARPGATTGSF